MTRDTLLFDFGGTVDADGERWSVRFHRAYLGSGGRTPFGIFEPAFRATDDALARLPAIERLGLAATMHAQAELLRAELGENGALDWRCVADAVLAETRATLERNRPMLEELRGRYRLGIVSNFNGNLDTCLEEIGFAPLFDAVVDSGRVGVTKPDPRIFAIALDALDARPEQAWMIGDNFEADIRPAAAIGLASCWLAPAARPAPQPDVSTARIERLTDLAGALG